VPAQPCLATRLGVARRLDEVEVIGQGSALKLAGGRGLRPIAEHLGVLRATARAWWRRFQVVVDHAHALIRLELFGLDTPPMPASMCGRVSNPAGTRLSATPRAAVSKQSRRLANLDSGTRADPRASDRHRARSWTGIRADDPAPSGGAVGFRRLGREPLCSARRPRGRDV
jgi:hypothetical protein